MPNVKGAEVSAFLVQNIGHPSINTLSFALPKSKHDGLQKRSSF